MDLVCAAQAIQDAAKLFMERLVDVVPEHDLDPKPSIDLPDGTFVLAFICAQLSQQRIFEHGPIQIKVRNRGELAVIDGWELPLALSLDAVMRVGVRLLQLDFIALYDVWELPLDDSVAKVLEL
eukprot:scaffold131514_cov21-Tisochrysis_lutea.AAC.1